MEERSCNNYLHSNLVELVVLETFSYGKSRIDDKPPGCVQDRLKVLYNLLFPNLIWKTEQQGRLHFIYKGAGEGGGRGVNQDPTSTLEKYYDFKNQRDSGLENELCLSTCMTADLIKTLICTEHEL